MHFHLSLAEGKVAVLLGFRGLGLRFLISLLASAALRGLYVRGPHNRRPCGSREL